MNTRETEQLNLKYPTYQEVKKALKEKNKNDKFSKQQLLQVEKAIFNDLVAIDCQCRKCNRTKELTLDHIVPKDILRQFGVDIDREAIEGNYQLLCRLCNVFKANRMDFSIPETRAILEQLIKERL